MTLHMIEYLIDTFVKAKEEGIMHTDGNAGSVISVTPEMRAELLETLKEEAVQTFLSNVKALGLSFQQSIALLTEKWEE